MVNQWKKFEFVHHQIYTSIIILLEMIRILFDATLSNINTCSWPGDIRYRCCGGFGFSTNQNASFIATNQSQARYVSCDIRQQQWVKLDYCLPVNLFRKVINTAGEQVHLLSSSWFSFERLGWLCIYFLQICTNTIRQLYCFIA